MDDFKKNEQEAGVSRRTFLYSLGALMLSACGGGSGATGAAVSRTASSGTSAAATGSALAHVATGAADVTTSGAFVHPGLLHTQGDFDRMALKVSTQASPWIDGWNV